LEGSPDVVIGMSGSLKGGAASVPFAPSHPPARLAYLLGDAQAPVIVTAPALAARIGGRAEAVQLDGEQRDDAPASGGGGDDLAYVMYTSRSTGAPKGVCGPHRAAVRPGDGPHHAALGRGPAGLPARRAALAFPA